MKVYRVEITEFALKDLEEAKRFYAAILPELGDYFIDTLLTDIESLAFYAGIHQKIEGLYRLLSRRFPYGIYYRIVGSQKVQVVAVLDLRRDPGKNRDRLETR